MFGPNRDAVDVYTAHEMAKNDGWIVVDVRTAPERQVAAAAGSIHYTLDSLPRNLSALKGQRVLAICRSGNRSATAARFLAQHGIEALNVKGGMIAWDRADLPIQKGN